MKMDASDIFFVAGSPYAFKIKNEIIKQDDVRLMPEDLKDIVQPVSYTHLDVYKRQREYNGQELKVETVTPSGDGFVEGEGATYSNFCLLYTSG